MAEKSSLTSNDLRMREKIEAERTARQMDIEAYCLSLSPENYSDIIDIARKADALLLIVCSERFPGRIWESDEPELHNYLEPWRFKFSTLALLLDSFERPHVYLNAITSDPAFGILELELSPSQITTALWTQTPEMERCLLGDTLLHSKEFDGLICIMRIMRGWDFCYDEKSPIDDFRAFCKFRPRSDTSDYPLEAFVRLFLANPDLKVLERWVCTKPYAVNGSLQVMELTD
ncbi:hypothetical protein B0J13DRAFT_622665 [Dactylonectria estremocensis]|uniref:Uncharacterized protein n=1 Tax=Dactylonectria estremocensis TaxID=1079267 RepID=A0A9P9EWL4_9HYPO|nr:hypothetical protein B0J13DRAFT_622665 [Dactylonectria estremocensis]